MRNDGGAAFPGTLDRTALEQPAPGMSLRDYFAAAALPSLGSHGQHWTGGHESPNMWIVLAERAYDIADAMLAERDKP